MATIEYFYAAHSAFAYLGAQRLAEIGAGHTIVHRPVDLSKVLGAAGVTSFSARTPEHKQYYFRREIERWAEFRNAPVMDGRPTFHDNSVDLANCMLIAGIEAGLDIQPLSYAMLQSHWRDDSDLADAATLQALGNALGMDAAALLAQADTADIRQIYTANTNEAIARSMFGSPTYFVDGDMFYGQDRLEMVERALRQPFAGNWP